MSRLLRFLRTSSDTSSMASSKTLHDIRAGMRAMQVARLVSRASAVLQERASAFAHYFCRQREDEAAHMQDFVGVWEATTAASSRCWRSAEVAASSGMSCTASLNHFRPGSCVACSAFLLYDMIAKHFAMPAVDWMNETKLVDSAVLLTARSGA